MKKIYLLIIVVFSSFASFAQDKGSSSLFSTSKADQGIKFGLEVGLNYSKLTGDVDDAKSRLGFNAGVSMNIPFMKSLYLKTGLQYTEKGVKEKGGDAKIVAGYIELPVLASYRYDFNRQTQLQINFGPYFAYGVTGEAKSISAFVFEADTFGDDGVLKRFDVGLHVGVGCTVSERGYIGVGYEFGLKDVNNTDTDVSLKNANLFINVGCFI